MSDGGAWEAELKRIDMVNHALAYARRGWPIIPIWWPKQRGVCACPNNECGNIAKHPCFPHQKFTTDEQTIRQWWSRFPLAGIGVTTGEAVGFTVLDVDYRDGGDLTFAKLMQRHGRPEPTVVSVSGGGGRHILWKYRPSHKISVGKLKGIDVFTGGKFFIAPPSIHESGKRYQWHKDGHPRNTQIVWAPTWVERIFRGEYGVTNGKRKTPLKAEPIGEGGRNDALFRHACRFQGQGVSDEELSDKVHELNEKFCKPPLTTREVETLISSALRYNKGNNR